MANDIPTGLRVPSQVPLDYKTYSQSEAALQNLGVDNQLAYTYHKGLRVTCILERTIWEWKEMEVGDVGLLPANFIYPNGLIVEGIDYSNKEYNFVNTAAPLAPLETIDEGEGIGIIIRGRDPLNYGPIGLNSVDLSYSDEADTTYGATGELSFAVGYQTLASGYNSFASGYQTSAIGGSSHAEGFVTEAIGNNSHAEGYNATANGYASHCEGNNTTTNGLYSHAEGNATIAQGSASHAEGQNTTSGGQASHAEGIGSSSSGDFSHAEGQGTVASGFAGHAEGGLSVSNGDYAHAGGNYNYARSFGEFSTGIFGTDVAGSASTRVLTDRLFNIGNGVSNASRSDAFTILKNGLGTLPSVTNALITAGSVKSIITKEYLTSFYSLDSNVVHKTGNETITGQKIFSAISTFDNLINANAGISRTIAITGASTRGLEITNNATDNSSYNSISLSSGAGQLPDLLKAVNVNSTGGKFISQTTASIENFSVNKLGDVTGTKFIKSGGTSAQYLMADGSVSTAGATIQSIVITGSWTLNGGYVVDTTLGLGKTLISVTPTLVCTVSNNGYAVGDIVNISATQANDSGGLADSGVGIRFIPSVSDKFTFNVNGRLDISNCYNGSVGTGGAISDPAQAIPSEWNMRTVILYI